MTKERRFGNHVLNENMTKKSTYQQGVEEELARQIALYVKEDPLCFLKDRDARDKLLARFEHDVSVLRNYPEVVRAMFKTVGEAAPQKLIPEKIRENGLQVSSAPRKTIKVILGSQLPDEEALLKKSSGNKMQSANAVIQD